jgi:hypothetical protein
VAGELTESWRDIVGYEGHYQVSDQGRVRSLPRHRRGHLGAPTLVRGRVLKQATSGRYPMVLLCREGQRRAHSVHRLVAVAFLRPDPSRPEVNHRDGVRTNNSVSNLEWMTRSENVAHSYQLHGPRRKVA